LSTFGSKADASSEHAGGLNLGTTLPDEHCDRSKLKSAAALDAVNDLIGFGRGVVTTLSWFRESWFSGEGLFGEALYGVATDCLSPLFATTENL
jgi:hypothetical protein